MDKLLIAFLHRSILPVLIVFLSACGGGGSNSSQNSNPDSDAGNTSETNRGLTGKIYFGGTGDFMELDISTGKKRVFSSEESELIAISYSGSEYALRRDSYGGYTDYVTIKNFQGEITNETISSGSGSFDSEPLVSPDDKLVAVLLRAAGSYTLAIYNRQGEMVTDYSSSQTELDSFTWLPNGRLVIATGNTIFSVDPTTTNQPKVIAKLAHNPHFISASRNGQQLTFTLATESEQNVYVMNIDGSGLRRLTKSDKPEAVPVWSPDGKHIAFLEDAYTRYDSDYGKCAYIYIVNSDLTEVDISSEPNTNKAFPLVTLSNNLRTRVCVFAGMDWR
ncbi:hypothetical protein BTA51_05245 [Hahella sp. CCB-MM4]|uniref:TolB family protein n=1 Tax=Hahella sp. (strain CCB-MM4) TaxID=1926491 RepID=UPI000BC8C92E|nr:PD40 domain-containing protein [Hahella sp. CCB-MM4]OZG74415.1 hypothetical protein BTA51_05245 [Hahella sp. CCB-MM4]